MSSLEKKNRVVFITGSSSGIGKETAYLFAAHGDSLVLTYHYHKDEGDLAAAKCLALGAKDVLLINLDLTDNESILNVVKTIIDKYSHLDILINNAAFLGKGLLAEQNLATIRLIIKTNLEGPVKLTRACLPHLQESIVNIGSNLGIYPKGGLTVYSATKSGIRSFSKALAEEARHLKIYTVNPSLTATKMGSPAGMAPEKVAAIIFNAALGTYKEKSGADINVWDYIYGSKLKKY